MMDRTQYSRPFLIVAAALLATVVVVLWQAPPLFRALFTSVSDEAPDASIETYQARHTDTAKLIQDRILGRSLFFPPPPPPPPRETPRQPTTIVKEETPPPPPPPAEYAGPLTLTFIVGDEAWFSKAGRTMIRLHPGDEDSGVKLLSTAPPWSVQVFWKEREYTVRQFKNWPKTDPFETYSPRPSTPPPGLIEASDAAGPGVGPGADPNAPTPAGSMSTAARIR